MKLKFFLSALSLFFLSTSSWAKVVLPSVFSNGMVLQRNAEVAIWGSSDTQKEVVINTSWNGKSYKVKATAGQWKAKVTTPAAGGPYTITINDGEETKLQDILIGEVWVASGQSNMEMPLRGFKDQPVSNAEEIIKNAANNKIRLFLGEKVTWSNPLNEVKGQWQAATPTVVTEFSAVAYGFAKILQEKLKVPVGIIQVAWGGTLVQAWMSAKSLGPYPEVKIPEANNTALKDKNVATGLFNAMIHPILGYNIKGVIWYQGEQNRHEPENYLKMFPDMVNDWRSRWGIGNFAFYYVQIAPYISKTEKLSKALEELQPKVPFLREVQLKAEQIIPNSGMAVIMDVGAQNTIHPPDKQTVSDRLSFIALNKSYGFKNVAYQGPVYKSQSVNGSKVLLKFDYAKQLKFKGDAKESSNFEVAGKNQVFYPAKAVITKDGILVSASEVAEPVSVRYAFKAWALGDLVNEHGLPASSFRTDNWVIPM
ncbi:sialate O-acetylesterase [Pedobacter chitinilyticus]|uniref:Sialate O-acetylesterase n=1 Tax=Pedobacter chitinilyticus TaxID=2233776 RepID=A0A3S3PD67_9SPHI|nr:sialate O-acetylesterase [Pedobacter chitinilyticus]RWU10143.1 sialate O-acetylesterase [Pedobacter chitinilyticus]